MTVRPFRSTPPTGFTERELGEAVRQLQQGKMNAVTTVTLTPSAGSTTLTDARLGPESFIGLMPATANAAAEIGNGTLYVSARSKRSATITHANNAQADRTFVVLIIG